MAPDHFTTPIISLITPTPPDISAFGVRALSADLKRHGYFVRCIFLPGGIGKLKHGGKYTYQYSDSLLYQIENVVADSTIIGLSFMSQYRDRAIQITEYLKSRLNSFFVWGGIHAEALPEDALKYANAACIDEGENALRELAERLAQKQAVDDIDGLVTSRDHLEEKLTNCRLIRDLDALPHLDIGPDNHWVLDPIEDMLKPMDNALMESIMPLMPAMGGGALKVYRTMTSRGCPHRCTYCANRIKAERHPGEQYLRFQSPEHVLGELQMAVNQYPFIQGIHFFDDVFTAMPEAQLETLCRLVRDEIGLPFYAQASPATITRNQVEMMIENGLVFLDMGIQTGSEKIRRIYKRPETNDQILEGTVIIDEYRRAGKLLKPHYHVILDNPWSSLHDERQTLNLLTRIPGKFKLCLASLTFYPGTDLNLMAAKAGLIQDIEQEIYRKPFYIPKGRYINYLIYLADITWIPRHLLRILGRGPARIFDRPVWGGFFDLARRITDKLRLWGKGANAILHGQFGRIFNYFKKVK